MAGKFARLQKIENVAAAPGETHCEFMEHLQFALLLALREQGRLTAMQYRSALEIWNRQRQGQEEA